MLMKYWTITPVSWFKRVYLDVAVPHVVLVSLQSQISVLFIDEADQSFSVPPSLSVKAQRRTTSVAQHHIFGYKYFVNNTPSAFLYKAKQLLLK